MYTKLLVFKTKLLIKFMRLIGKNASALPGLIVEKFSPNFLERVLKPVEGRIVIVTGTNGKTTTTKMVVHALRSIGKTVVTNETGSNMTRGLISALLEDMTISGSLRPTDWFVFEMDEAYAPIFTKNLKIHSVVGLNVLRDQLDRYGEIDKTARLIGQAASAANNFVYNGQDKLLTESAQRLESDGTKIFSFGVVNKLTSKLRNEQNMYSSANQETGDWDLTLTRAIDAADNQTVTVEHKQEQIELVIPMAGLHNAVNVTAVVAVLNVLEPAEYKNAVVAIKTMKTPFGRGEVLRLNNKVVTVALVKNPSGFSHNLETFVTDTQPEYIIFAVNDRFADGRDMSWLWDVQFKGHVSESAQLITTGIRGYDMALRLKHDGLKSETELSVESAISKAMKSDVKKIIIIPTYTALYEVRSALSKYGEVPRIW